MRMYIFILFAAVLLITFILAGPLAAFPIIPSVLLAYWVWEDGDAIAILRERLEVWKTRLA